MEILGKILKERYKKHRIINVIALAFLLLCAGFIVKPVVSEAGTYGMFYFTMDTKTNEIRIDGLNDSAQGITDIVIPAQINGYVVTGISSEAFEGNENITSVSFEAGAGVKKIGYQAFSGCTGLVSVALPASVSSIGYEAFSGCTKLTSIVLPASVRDIGSSAFSGCTSLTAIAIPEGVTVASYGMCSGCSALSSVTLPSTLTSIDTYAFKNCALLKEINLPGSLKSIGDYWNGGQAFAGSGLESIVIPDSVTEIYYGSFMNCANLVSVTLSKNLKTIERSMFSGCSVLKTVNLPIDIETIGKNAFMDCAELESITIGDAIKKIESDAFSGCPKLVVRTVRGTIAEAYCMNNNIQYVTYASSIRGCTIEGIVEKTYTGGAHTQNLVVKLGVVPLTQNVDYTVAYSDNVNVGTATLTITGTGNYIGHIDKTFHIAPVSIDKAKIKIKSRIKYNAKYQTPKVKVTLNGKTLPESVYSVYYYGNCFVGTATVTVSGHGNYRGTIKRNFTIVPGGTKIKSVKGARKSIIVSYKENHIQTTGYQVQYSTDKKFSKKKSKIVGVKSNLKKKRTINGLKARKKYYVRVRTFALVNGKKICSSWSPAKSVRTR